MAHVFILAVLALVLIVPLATTPAAARTCTSAQVEEAFALPDGSVHPAGRLTLCFSSAYTPVRTLQRTFVDGRPVGMFASRRQIVERPEEPGYYLIFNRRSVSPIRLAGYAQPSSRRARWCWWPRRCAESSSEVGRSWRAVVRRCLAFGFAGQVHRE